MDTEGYYTSWYSNYFWMYAQYNDIWVNGSQLGSTVETIKLSIYLLSFGFAIYGQYCGYQSFDKQTNHRLGIFNFSVGITMICEGALFAFFLQYYYISYPNIYNISFNDIAGLISMILFCLSLYQYRISWKFNDKICEQQIKEKVSVPALVFQF